MSSQKVKLGSILKESKVVSEFPDTNKRIKVRLKVLGVEKRGIENEVEGATKQFIRKAGQFIYGKQNFHKGAFGIVPKELDGFESSSDLPAFDVDKSCLPEFLFYFFKKGNYYLELSKIASGVATQRINTSQFFDLEILLPEIEIQKTLLKNIKILENNGGEILSELTHQLDLIKQLRQAFLREAMQGKLLTAVRSSAVEKQATGHELLAQIKAEKAQLIAEKKLKKEKELAPITTDEFPFEIPEHWAWCRLGEICDKIIDCPHSTPKYLETETDFFGIDTNCIDDRNQIYRLRNLSEDQYNERTRRSTLIIDDIIFAREGSIGKAVILKENKKICLGQRVMMFRPSKVILPKFLLLLTTSPNYLQKLLEKHKGMGAKHVNVKDVVASLIPLPPLHEQEQIVAKLEDLMAFCDGLEQSIKESQGYNEQLLQQVLREALQG